MIIEYIDLCLVGTVCRWRGFWPADWFLSTSWTMVNMNWSAPPSSSLFWRSSDSYHSRLWLHNWQVGICADFLIETWRHSTWCVKAWHSTSVDAFMHGDATFFLNPFCTLKVSKSISDDQTFGSMSTHLLFVLQVWNSTSGQRRPRWCSGVMWRNERWSHRWTVCIMLKASCGSTS